MKIVSNKLKNIELGDLVTWNQDGVKCIVIDICERGKSFSLLEVETMQVVEDFESLESLSKDCELYAKHNSIKLVVDEI